MKNYVVTVKGWVENYYIKAKSIVEASHLVKKYLRRDYGYIQEYIIYNGYIPKYILEHRNTNRWLIKRD